jgi:hypothetical protein
MSGSRNDAVNWVTTLGISVSIHSMGNPGVENSRELLGGVDDEAGTVEVLVAHAVRVVVAAVGIAVAGVAVLRVGTAAASTNAILADVVGVLAGLAAVGGQGEGIGVGLPDVDLGAARTLKTNTGVLIVRVGGPALVVGLSTLSAISLSLINQNGTLREDLRYHRGT